MYFVVYSDIQIRLHSGKVITREYSSIDFFTLVKEHLSEDGVMVVNMNMHGSKDGNINQYLADTIGQVFQTEYTVDVAGSTNRELFASDNEDILDILASNTEQLNNNELQAMMSKVAAESSRYVKSDYVLTDDQAPVELLGMQMIDELIKDEVAYYKDIYEKDGISGVLEVF